MDTILRRGSVALIGVMSFFGHLGCGEERSAPASSSARPPSSSSSSSSSSSGPTAIAAPQQHWVQGAKLKQVMDQLAGLRGAIPKGLPEDAESPQGREVRRAMAETAAVADALADTATRIPAAVAGKPMTEADRRGFIAEADRLRNQAIQLRDAARENRVEPPQGMLDGVNATCIACHSRYRDLTGDLNTHKAAAPGGGREGDALAVRR